MSLIKGLLSLLWEQTAAAFPPMERVSIGKPAVGSSTKLLASDHASRHRHCTQVHIPLLLQADLSWGSSLASQPQPRQVRGSFVGRTGGALCKAMGPCAVNGACGYRGPSILSSQPALPEHYACAPAVAHLG